MLLFLVYNYLRDLIGYLTEFLKSNNQNACFLTLIFIELHLFCNELPLFCIVLLENCTSLGQSEPILFSSVSLNKSLKVNYFTQKLSYLSLIKASILYSVFQITEKLICTAHVLVPHSCFSIFWYVKYCFHFWHKMTCSGMN